MLERFVCQRSADRCCLIRTSERRGANPRPGMTPRVSPIHLRINMDTQKYNGWTNWATWMVNLHFDSCFFTDGEVEAGVFDDMDKDDIRCYVASWIQEYVESYLDDVVDNDNIFVQDLIFGTMQDVDWHDIADHYVDDILDELKDRELVAA